MRRKYYQHDHLRKGWIKCLSIIYIILGAILISATFYLKSNILEDNTDISREYAITLIYVAQFIFICGISSAILILYLLKFSDEFLMENKYALVCFGILGGQFLIPLIISYCIPNTESTTRSSTKIVLSKLTGIICSIIGILAFIDLAGMYVLNNNYITNNMLLKIAIAPGIFLIYGLINVLLFKKDRIDGIYESNSAGGFFKGLFAMINIIFITIGLVVTIWMSILSILSGIARMFSAIFESKGILSSGLNFFYAQLEIMRGIFIVKMATQTLKTIYARKHYTMQKSLYLENHLAKATNS
ncbi:hypothetical protein [Spiroplasma endosymbiont of Aspidapion aeneum]|uniref:hypothetical protein n=1 Tax=Spiroplasma endosymbiont of Aspidapion aeneum TaxID=3066276 RepID=UPI00313F2D5F